MNLKKMLLLAITTLFVSGSTIFSGKENGACGKRNGSCKSGTNNKNRKRSGEYKRKSKKMESTRTDEMSDSK